MQHMHQLLHFIWNSKILFCFFFSFAIRWKKNSNDKDSKEKLVADIIGMLYLRQFCICCVRSSLRVFFFVLFAFCECYVIWSVVHIFMVHRHKVLSYIKHTACTDLSLFCACILWREVQLVREQLHRNWHKCK